ncbi:hypothetical protein Cgig2_019839 [Carnegiea gigantea]|uniref:Transposase-associated domain-containing protein n=1 Tax=Carnegiea gigantea TaxID=171969 RepID=A0A9Q1GQ42_9CARY|nr:hypothetical protein Cgig2_019839 [Carnegiea gigantea]
MDHRKRKWIDTNNWHEYLGGVNEFLEVAFRNKDEKVPCPCKKCVNQFHRSKEEIFDHLVEHRMIKDYDTWYCHGESLHASGMTTTLNMNQTVNNDDLNDDDDDDDDVMDIEHMAHFNRITHRRHPTPHDKERMHSEGFSDWLNGHAKFIIPNLVAESYVLKSMGRKWRNFKADLNSSIMSQTAKIPNCVPKDQWISLVTYWIFDKGKTVNGVEPSRAHVYIDTHNDRKTRPPPMDEKSKKAVDMINKKLSGKEVTNGSVAWEGDICSQVMKEVIGEERRGLGPSSLASLSLSQCGEHLDDDHDQCSERMELLEAENKRLQDKLTHLKGQQIEVLAEIARL